MVSFTSSPAGDRRRRSVWSIPAGFLFLDLLLIVLHAAFGVLIVTNRAADWPPLVNIGMDWSAGEVLNYVKWAVAAYALFWLYRTERMMLALVFAVAFSVALLDDSLQLHERLGAKIGWNFLPQMGEMSKAIGELVVFALSGLAFLAGLCVAWSRSNVSGQRIGRNLVALLVLLGACAVLADLAHAVALSDSVVKGVLGIVEDGGEMLVLTAIVSYCMRLTQR